MAIDNGMKLDIYRQDPSSAGLICELESNAPYTTIKLHKITRLKKNLSYWGTNQQYISDIE